jgi:flagellar protein FlaG
MSSQITSVGGASFQPGGAGPAPVIVRSAPASVPVAQVQSAGSQEVAVAQVNQHLRASQTDLKLEVDAGSGRTVFQVVQQGTGQVVLQIPSEEVLGMSRRIRQMESQTGNSGALVDKEG